MNNITITRAPSRDMASYVSQNAPQWYINVYQIPNDGSRWLGRAVDSKTLSDELACRGHALYRLRVKLKDKA
jgi:hypothetical protein